VLKEEYDYAGAVPSYATAIGRRLPLETGGSIKPI
jgi:hypothetical protein